MRKLHSHLRAGKEAAVERTLPKPRAMPVMAPHAADLDEDLEEAGRVGELAQCLIRRPVQSSLHSHVPAVTA